MKVLVKHLMSTKRKVMTSAAVAVIAAIALISAAILSPGMLGTSSTAQAGSGTLAVMLTDPPTVPNGVSAVYATYNDLQVHVSDAGNQSGWYDLHSSGEINLMSIVNVSQTIASTNVPSGVYNLLRFNITSAIVTYQGANYTALLLENTQGASSLTVGIAGGLNVASQQTSAAVIDLTPTVLLLGNTSDPTFAFIPTARAYTIPSNSIAREYMHIGHRLDLRNQGWWKHIQENGHFQINAASLSTNSLSISVANNGNTSIVFRLAAVTSTTSATGGDSSIASTSAFFAVEPNQTLVAINAGSRMQIAQTVAAGGYLLAPHSSATFTYSGPIVIGSLSIQGYVHNNQVNLPTTTQSVIPGVRYVISLSGSALIAQTSVVASS